MSELIEKTVLDFLSDNLDAPCFMEVPADPPGKFVTIEKTGSSRSNRIPSCTFAIQSWAASMLDAAKLNDEVKKAMDRLVELSRISRSHLNSDYNFTDTSTKHYRYQAVFDLTYYEGE